jgi:4'-phosphopantetheinyl transferase EntD
MAVLAEMLPPEAVAVEAFDDARDAPLFPEEEATVRRAVEKRRREFATTRMCARAALAQLGVPAVAILPGDRGAPQWPAGIVGSMTHCLGYRAAAVARAEHVVTIGLDAEPDAALPGGVLQVVASPSEQARLSALAAAFPGPSWDRLLFSAKESVYKAWFPLTQKWLGFDDADITIDPTDGTFAARLLVPGPVLDGGPLTGFTGRWVARHELIATTIAVPRPRPADR